MTRDAAWASGRRSVPASRSAAPDQRLRAAFAVGARDQNATQRVVRVAQGVQQRARPVEAQAHAKTAARLQALEDRAGSADRSRRASRPAASLTAHAIGVEVVLVEDALVEAW